MQNTIQSITAILQRNNADNDDDADTIGSEAKLAQILRDASSDADNKDRIDAVEAFMSLGDIQRRKVLSYCLDFFDPTVQAQPVAVNGELIQQHRFLQEDELAKLNKFVKQHSRDGTFGETVYAIIAKHDMTPTQVFVNSMLRKQDFYRAVDARSKNITRHIVWQIIIGLRCDLREADEVLFGAGYVRRNNKFDTVMTYFVEQKNYDIMAINDVLSELGIKTFSCYSQSSLKDKKR